MLKRKRSRQRKLILQIKHNTDFTHHLGTEEFISVADWDGGLCIVPDLCLSVTRALFFVFPASSSVVPVPGTFSWPLAPRGKPRRGMLRRAVFSDLQRKALERTFQKQKYISKPDRKKLAGKLGLKDSQVKNLSRQATYRLCSKDVQTSVDWFCIFCVDFVRSV